MELRKIEIKKMNKRGGVADLIIWMAIGFVMVLFFAVWIYGFNQLSTTLLGLDGNILNQTGYANDYESVADIASDTIAHVDTVQTNSLHILAFVILFVNALAIPLTYFIQKTHPAFFVFYLFMIIASFIASVYISNQYESLMTNEVIGTTLSAFTGASFIMLNLPMWVAIIGAMGMIIAMSGIIRDAGAGGSVS